MAKAFCTWCGNHRWCVVVPEYIETTHSRTKKESEGISGYICKNCEEEYFQGSISRIQELPDAEEMLF